MSRVHYNKCDRCGYMCPDGEQDGRAFASFVMLDVVISPLETPTVFHPGRWDFCATCQSELKVWLKAFERPIEDTDRSAKRSEGDDAGARG